MMVNDGTIRVGSLVDYQNAEKHSGGVLDEAEGTRTTVVQAGAHEVWTNENMPEPVKAILGEIPANQAWHVHGSTFSAVYVANAFVYCLSMKYDEALLDESQFDADAIVEIIDTAGFFAAVDVVMAEYGCRFFNAVECKYVGRVAPDGDRRTLYHAVEVKEERYSKQAECRLVWRARDDTVDKPAIMVTHRSIASACRRIY
ncbi:hypothetical protein LK996_09600 [Lysobacter sp. A6]|uniref:Uncharacterized protein n=1 Tax=Noviluteimonas lactosilytica TaxID=2888523 RepID=A0ABS8JIC3_9GAMM|nr:hypothetical protein [Lysobacter lactosilyticus]MCC8363326.1 hypothetical protein [Lysobacter lactosilyticus]